MGMGKLLIFDQEGGRDAALGFGLMHAEIVNFNLALLTLGTN
jgi:hypothetical protein